MKWTHCAAEHRAALAAGKVANAVPAVGSAMMRTGNVVPAADKAAANAAAAGNVALGAANGVVAGKRRQSKRKIVSA